MCTNTHTHTHTHTHTRTHTHAHFGIIILIYNNKYAIEGNFHWVYMCIAELPKAETYLSPKRGNFVNC